MEEGVVKAAHFLAARNKEGEGDGKEEKRERERERSRFVAEIQQEMLFKGIPQVTYFFHLCPNS